MDLNVLARLLRFSVGINNVTRRNGRVIHWRAASSAGNRHPIETYVVYGGGPELVPGVFHFAPDAPGLEELHHGDHRGFVAAAAADPALASAEALLILTGVPWRTSWKYAERGLRHLYWDAGTVLAHVLALAEASGVPARLLFGFEDMTLSKLLGIDGREEFPLAIVALGTQPHVLSAPMTDPGPPSVDPAASPKGVRFPLITMTQQAGALHDGDMVRAWRDNPAGQPTTMGLAGPAPVPVSESIEQVISRRTSTRTMQRAEIPRELMDWTMACATRPVSTDVLPPDHTLLTNWLAVHAIAGAPSGLHRRVGTEIGLRQGMPAAQARAMTAHLCLDQKQGGESAFTLFVCADLAPVLKNLGDRGYRVAQIAAGIAIGRLQLSAAALTFGACGLTFYDDEVSRATGSDCLVACAVGTPVSHRARLCPVRLEER
ncbi:SagB family peptide dehydrogenase [Streptomyces achromogenes]